MDIKHEIIEDDLFVKMQQLDIFLSEQINQK